MSELRAELKHQGSDGWYTATVSTDEAANGNVLLRLTSKYHHERVAEIAMPPEIVAEFAALLALWFPRKARP